VKWKEGYPNGQTSQKFTNSIKALSLRPSNLMPQMGWQNSHQGAWMEADYKEVCSNRLNPYQQVSAALEVVECNAAGCLGLSELHLSIPALALSLVHPSFGFLPKTIFSELLAVNSYLTANILPNVIDGCHRYYR
jgi:hypothetical protein